MEAAPVARRGPTGTGGISRGPAAEGLARHIRPLCCLLQAECHVPRVRTANRRRGGRGSRSGACKGVQPAEDPDSRSAASAGPQCAVPEDGQCTVPEDGQCAVPEDGQCAVPEDGQCAVPEDGQCAVPEDGQCAVPEDGQCAVPEDGQWLCAAVAARPGPGPAPVWDQGAGSEQATLGRWHGAE